MRSSVFSPVGRSAVGRSTGPTSGQRVSKRFAAEVKEVGDRLLDFVISTEDLDRDGDTIAVDGWKLDNFGKNPVMLWAHDYRQPPVGKAARVWTEGGKLRARVEFPEADLYPFGDTVYRLYKEGYLSATSVGFVPLKWSYAQGEDRPYGIDFEEQELLEFSAVPVPSNPEALVAASAAGIPTAQLRTWARETLARTPESSGTDSELLDLSELDPALVRRWLREFFEGGFRGEDPADGLLDFARAKPEKARRWMAEFLAGRG
jgi:HK97 family phage prohead protease